MAFKNNWEFENTREIARLNSLNLFVPSTLIKFFQCLQIYGVFRDSVIMD